MKNIDAINTVRALAEWTVTGGTCDLSSDMAFEIDCDKHNTQKLE